MPRSRNDLFSKLFVERGAALKRYVQRLVRSRDTADEIVQEAFLRTYEHANVDIDEPPSALLYAIARNLAMDHYRHQRSARTETMGDIRASIVFTEPGGDCLESWLLAEEQSSLLKIAIERLPPQCRAAFALKVFHCCSYREIAQRLSISQKTVEAHISRGIRDSYRYLRKRYQIKDATAGHG